MELNINNTQPRIIVCHKNPADVDENPMGWFTHAKKLTKGKKYHMVRMDVHNWHTEVYLDEFPNIPFNSVLFCENENIKLIQILQDVKQESRCIFHTSLLKDLNLRLADKYSVKVTKGKLKTMNDGDVLIFGRSPKCDICLLKHDEKISPVHFYIKKVGITYQVYDCSKLGTTILG